MSLNTIGDIEIFCLPEFPELNNEDMEIQAGYLC